MYYDGKEGKTGLATVAAQLQYDHLDGGSCTILDGPYCRYRGSCNKAVNTQWLVRYLILTAICSELS